MSCDDQQNATHSNSPVGPVTSPQAGGIGDLGKRLGPAAILGIIATVLPPLGSIVLFWKINQIGQWLRDHGTSGPFVYVGGFIVLTGLALLPTYASAILGGWAFGFEVGGIAAMSGFTGAAILGYVIGRLGSGDRVERILAEKPRWKAVRDALVGGSFAKTFAIVTLLRLPPNSPFAITNLVLASVKTNPVAYVLGTIIGMAPRTLIVIYIAADLAQRLDPAQAAEAKKPMWLIVGGIAVSVAVLGLIGFIAKRALDRVVKK
jgi:uncharacterized membrane protein YdjX (TVP38/TMEM64 family)